MRWKFRLRHRANRFLACTSVACVSMFGGCGGSGPKPPAPASEVDASLASLTSNTPASLELPDPRQTLTSDQKALWAQQSALDLESVLKQASEKSGPGTTGKETSPQSGKQISSQSDLLSPPTATAGGGNEAQALASPHDDLAAQNSAAVVAKESEPTATNVLGTASSPVSTGLDGLLTEEPPSVAASSPLRIARALLCSRVDGFGRYRPMASNTFVAGRVVRAIVYVELEGFRTRDARSGDPVLTTLAMDDQHTVELTQSLGLYADADGLLAWQRPAQRAIETTASPRKDFYLIQIIELPATLTIGRYNLKVTVNDATSKQQAEAILPISMVADPSAARSSR